jgi:hypothetical protein
METKKDMDEWVREQGTGRKAETKTRVAQQIRSLVPFFWDKITRSELIRGPFCA